MKRRSYQGGFSLLEVMIAMAILSGALTTLTVTLTRALRAANHARLMTTATFLCRAKLGEIEDSFITDGFTDEAGSIEKHGEFKDAPYKEPSFQRYQWSYTVEKIKLPEASDIQAAATKLLQDNQQIGANSQSSSSSSSGSSSTGTNIASSMGNMMGPVKEMLEQGIRRVTVRIFWDEPGARDQKVEVVTFYTDMRRIPVTQ
jgi:prepilin-type N-terminal cleavage/methylation domain-containing protein